MTRLIAAEYSDFGSNSDMVKCLVEKGVNINVRLKNDNTPLCLANEVGGKIKHERENQRYTQASPGSKVGVLEKQMSRYERRENPISIIIFCMIVVELLIEMAKLLPESTISTKIESKVEKTLDLVRECKKFRNQELCKIASTLNKSIQMGEEDRETGKKLKWQRIYLKLVFLLISSSKQQACLKMNLRNMIKQRYLIL
ncbi:hypothetical protein TNIN_149301 [Trichonephila inaurata madagascariensis]|uniref:Uncharacterized protein n=1 Tax=Trichonephila inaurata madagascariensis TaxID=2747483 RepID=A0A8X7CP78_9ARAC|nr:hypothetical protein TNIN_149301 [Trichonephila inaurata madagascariensis]